MNMLSVLLLGITEVLVIVVVTSFVLVAVFARSRGVNRKSRKKRK